MIGRATNDDGPYLGGVLVRSPQAVRSCLGVDVPEPTNAPARLKATRSLAEAGRDRFDADLTIAIGPNPAVVSTTGKPEKTFLALATRGEVLDKAVPYAAHLDILTTRIAKDALNFVRLHLQG